MFRENGGKINAHAALIAKIDARACMEQLARAKLTVSRKWEKKEYFWEMLAVLVCTYVRTTRAHAESQLLIL